MKKFIMAFLILITIAVAAITFHNELYMYSILYEPQLILALLALVIGSVLISIRLICWH